MQTVSGIPMVGTVGNKGLKAHRYETDTSVSVSFCVVDVVNGGLQLVIP